MLESGEAKSLKETAEREKIDYSYVSRMVNLTTLAPDIVAAIPDDALPNHVTLFDLAVDPPALWDEQRERAEVPGVERRCGGEADDRQVAEGLSEAKQVAALIEAGEQVAVDRGAVPVDALGSG